MKKALKWIGIVLGGAILLFILAALGLMVAGNARINRTEQIEAEIVNIPTDEAALARGAHLVDITCTDCHGSDLSGKLVVDDPALGVIWAANITGVAESQSDEELIMAIRHGLDSNGRQLMIMPSESFIYFSENDLGAIIAYLKTIPQTGSLPPTPQLRPVGRMLVGAGILDSLFPASYTDHDLPFPAHPEVAATTAYGEYLGQLCQGCHGAGLVGGTPPDPKSPLAPNLTLLGSSGGWTEEGFLTAMRIGATPTGRELRPEHMPWSSYAKFSDDELRALWMYLSSLEPIESASSE